MENLINNKKTLIISSLDMNGEPAISYSAYVVKNTDIYIYISKTAPHYKNIEENKKVDVMILEDESESPSLFARNRVSFKCIAEKSKNLEILEQFKEIHGNNIINMLQKLDFDIFKLQILQGRLVKGFGKAYDVQVSNEQFVIKQLTSDDIKGHK